MEIVLQDTEFIAKPDKIKCKYCTVQQYCKHAYDPEKEMIAKQIQFSKERRERALQNKKQESQSDEQIWTPAKDQN